MTRIALCLLLAASALSAQNDDPRDAVVKAYCQDAVAVYELEKSTGMVGSPPLEVTRQRVTFVRGEGYRAQGPIEILVHTDASKLYRCANHGLAKHAHFIEAADQKRHDLPELVEEDVLLAALRGGLGFPPQSEGTWTREGNVFTCKGDRGDGVAWTLDNTGRLSSFSSTVIGVLTTYTVQSYTAKKKAPKGALELGEPAETTAWPALCAEYVQPRLVYTVQIKTTSDSAFRNERVLSGVYSREQGFRVHLSAPGEWQIHPSALAISNLEHLWKGHECADALNPAPHACLTRTDYQEDSATSALLYDDFLLAANLGARGQEDVFWNEPWSKVGKRWLRHTEPAGSFTEAVFDKRGRLKVLRTVDEDVITTYEIAQLKTPRKLKDAVFTPNLKVHRPK